MKFNAAMLASRLDNHESFIVSLYRMKHTAIPAARAKLAGALPSTTEIVRGSLCRSLLDNLPINNGFATETS